MSEGGWHPDPFGRFDYRYFDGAQWTDRVSTAGAESTDPPVQSQTPPPTPPPPAAGAVPPGGPPPTAGASTGTLPPPGFGTPAPAAGGGSGSGRKLLPFLIAGGVGLLVLILLIVVIGGGDDGGGDGLGTEAFTIEGERAVFTKTFTVEKGEAFRVRVDPQGDWDPVIVLSAAEEDFAQAVRDNGEFLSDISALSDVDLDDDDSDILDSLFLSDTLESVVSDSGDLPDDLGRQVVLDERDNGFDGEPEGIADISFFDVELRITVYDFNAEESSERSGEVIVETTDEALDDGDIEALFSDDDLPPAFTDFLSDGDFLSN